jgi:DNA-binding NtrC family response regulator
MAYIGLTGTRSFIDMARPTLFYHLQDPKAERALMRSSAAAHFDKIASIPTESWLSQLENIQVDVALISNPQLSHEDYLNLVNSAMMSDREFIFFTDGQPNPYLDKLMSKGAGYHFRQPHDMALINDTLEDFAQNLIHTKSHVNQSFCSDLDQYGLLVGSSRAMHKLYRTIRKVATAESNVLIVGESGAGKELVANTIHLASSRSNEPFIAINCGALSPELVDSELFGHIKGAFTGAHRDHQGVFEQAQGGTLFLDEVTEMPVEHQVKLLRVIENNEYRPVGSTNVKHSNVRILSATNRDPLEAINKGHFREDLYFRLAHFPIQVPPLRDRGDDITALAQHFLAYRNVTENQCKAFSPETIALIAKQTWSGNVRELKHAVERAYILADNGIYPEHFNFSQDESLAESSDDGVIPTGMRLDELEKKAIYQTLISLQGNKTDTAKQLGISVKTLYNKLTKYEDDMSENVPPKDT